MKELNLTEDVIQNTVVKINTICTKYGYTEQISRRQMLISGNGDGNGSY